MWAADAPARGGYHSCSGTVQLKHGDYANHIKTKGLKCGRAKHVIKRPATKLGYSCETIGSGGNTGRILCTKGRKGVKFDYSQS